MPNIFKLSNISKIIENNHPVCILVVDTNVLMDEPDPANWNVTIGPTLFALSDGTVQELEYIRQKPPSRERADSRDKAAKAIKSLANLFSEGKITEGIPTKSGWVIGVPPPDRDQLEIELKQFEDTVKTFGHADTKLLILTKECSQSFETTPVTFLTAEVNLYNMAQMHEIPCHLCTGFPIENLKEVTEKIKDWDQVLRDIQVTTRQNSIDVEVTLTDYKSAPKWLGTESLMVAEGYGEVYDGNKNRTFLWTIPFYPRSIISSQKSSQENTADLPSVYLDFLGDDDFNQNLFDGIADRLSDCANIHFEEGKPTLQNPESVMEMLLYMEYIFREGVSEEALEKLRQEITESEGLLHYWTDWILGTEDEDERTACLEGFIEAVRGCWEIGQTYKFSFIPNK